MGRMNKQTNKQKILILNLIKENYKKAELKIIRRPSPIAFVCVCVHCVCRGAREGGGVVAHSVAVAHKQRGRAAHENKQHRFHTPETQCIRTSRPLQVYPAAKSYSDSPKNQRAIL